MRRLLYRLRGLLGLGVLGTAVGTIFGIGWGLIAHLGLGVRFYDAPLLVQMQVFGMVFGIIGATAGVGFGLLLTGTSGWLRLEALTENRVAALGGIAGAAAPLLVVSWIMASSLPPMGLAVPLVLIGGALGAGGSIGLLRIAKLGDGQPQLPDESMGRPE